MAGSYVPIFERWAADVPGGHYAVDFVADSADGAAVDTTWTAAAKADGVGRVRAAVLADQAGHVNWPLVGRGARAWQAVGVSVDGVCAFEYLPPFVDAHGATQYPNTPVGTGTHRLTTPYVERFRLQIEANGPAVIKAGMAGWYGWNEGQVGLVLPGDNCPPGTKLRRDKAGNPLDAVGNIVPWELAERIPAPNLNRSCIAPENYAALVWQTCHSLEHIGCQRRIAGAFNVLPQSGLDKANPYVLGYLGKVYAHLKACGVRPNWTHLGLTCEGYWTVATAQRLHDAFRAFMDAHGDGAELVVAEMGVRNKGADLDKLLTTFLAMEAVFGVGNAAIYCLPGLMPYLGPVLAYEEYGIFQWFRRGNHYERGAGYPIAPTVLKWLAT